MGKLKKRGTTGNAITFLTKKAACKKLQLSLAQFRRFCILKGIYPREVKKHPKGKDKTYFYYKDIVFLMHDPLVDIFRQRTIIKKKIKRAKGKGEKEQVERFKAMMPEYKLDHIIKERYPTFVDALRDLDDALCMVYLFAAMQTTHFTPPQRILGCERICREFEAYIVKSRSLRKTFVTVKGIYYQAEIFGQKVTWLVPHQFTQQRSEKVDYKVMMNFLDFYEALIGFVLYRLYQSIGLTYPPTFEKTKEEDGALELLLKELEKNQPELKQIQENENEKSKTLKTIADSRLKTLDPKKLLAYEKEQQEEQGDTKEEKVETNDSAMELDEEFYKEQTQLEKFKKLFHGRKIFVSREVPRTTLEFVIRCFEGQVSWEGPDAPFKENDEEISHQIVDRDSQKRQFLSRVYVQPQWVFDSINEKVLLPTSEYVVGATLPDHLSPFVDDENEGYKPKRREQLDKIKEALEKGTPYTWGEDEESEEEKEEKEEQEAENEDLEAKYQAELEAELQGKSFEQVQQETKKPNPKPKAGQKRKVEEDAKDPGAEILLTKKQRHLYNKLTSKVEAKKSRVSKLMNKRKKIENDSKNQEAVKTKKN